MFTVSLKLKKQNILSIILSVAIVVLIIVFIPLNNQAMSVVKLNKTPTCKNTEEIVEWINSFGWEVESEPFYNTTVTIPKKEDEIYTQYIINQRQNGYRLDKYKGKKVNQYKFKVLNYNEGKTEAYINILMYKDKIIASDICSPLKDGFMRPLKPFDEMQKKSK